VTDILCDIQRSSELPTDDLTAGFWLRRSLG